MLPSVDEDDNASEADLEARDLLFSRLLQYRAFKEAAKNIDARMGEYGSYVARDVPLEPHFATLLPELRWRTTPEDLARLAADALSATSPTVQVTHPARSGCPRARAGSARLVDARRGGAHDLP